MSELLNYKIRNYEENDVVKEIEIYNKVMKSFDPDASEYTVEYMDYRYKNENFDPRQVKLLVNTENNEIVGYSAVDFSETEAHVEYPFILEDHRSQELMDKLFKESLEFAKSKREKVTSDPYKPSLSDIVDFLKKHGAKPGDTYRNYGIDIEKLNYDISPIKSFDVTLDKVDKLNEFIRGAKKATGGEIDFENMKKQFDEGNYSPDRLQVLQLNGEILGVIGGSIEKPKNEGEPVTSRLNFYLMDLEHPKANEFRKNSVGALYKGLKNAGVSKFITGIGDESPAKAIFTKLGFTPEDEGFTKYSF